MMDTAYIIRTDLCFNSRHYDLTRIPHTSRTRIEMLLNSDAIQKKFEIDEGIIKIRFMPKAKALGAAMPSPITPPPVSPPPPPVEIPVPNRRPGTYFLNGVIQYGSVGITPLAMEKRA